MPRTQRFLCSVMVLLMAGTTLAQVRTEPVRDWDFEKDVAAWKAYRNADPKSALSRSSLEAHSGKNSLRVATPGKAELEGAVVRIKLTPKRNYVFTVRAKGDGQVMLGVCGSLGWTYSAKTNLIAEWKELKVRAFERGREVTLALFTCRGKPEKVEFYLDDVKVAVESEKALPSVAVEPVWFEAEDYSGSDRLLTKDDLGSGGACVSGARFHSLATRVPFPQTSKPVLLYLKVRIADNRRNVVTVEHGRQPAFAEKLPVAGKWTWLKAGPFSAEEIGPRFRISSNGPDEKVKASLDAIVISTRADMTDAQLDAAGRRYHADVGADSDKGLVVLGQTGAPPSLDGELNDNCWQTSVELSPFVLVNQDKSAKQQTKAYLCYDSANLYVAFRCVQSCLDPVNNELHAFRKEGTATDEPRIIKDDFVTILLDTNNDRDTFFDIFINGNGAVNDAICGGREPWVGRDKKWNSNAKVSARIGKGWWSVEAAIPFSSLGARPKAGDAWGICLGRSRWDKRETSTWQPIANGFHIAKDFAQVRFDDRALGIGSAGIGPFQRGKNSLAIRVTPFRPDMPLRIETSIGFDREERKVSLQDHVLSEQAELTCPYTLERDGRFSLRYSVLDPTNLRTFYRSPVYYADVTSSVLKAKVEAKAGFKMYVNGEQAKDNEAPLIEGENVVAIETNGLIKGNVSVGDFFFNLDDTWKYSTSKTEGWNKKGLDEKDWQKAVSNDGWLGKEGKALYFRKIILQKHSRLWPDWGKGGLHICEDSVHQVYLLPEAAKAGQSSLKGHKLYFEAPAPFRVLGASSYYKMWPVTFEAAGTVKRGDQEYRRFRVTTSRLHPYAKTMRSHQFVSIPVELQRLDDPFVPRQALFYYYLEADDGHIQEVPQKLKVVTMPPLQGKQPKEYVLQLWAGFLARMDDLELRKPILQSIARMGFNEVGYSDPMPPDVDIKAFTLLPLHYMVIGYLKKFPDKPAIDIHMKATDRICPSLLFGDSPESQHVAEEIQKMVKARQIHHFNWDVESGVWEGYFSCYCPRCLTQFSKAAGIPAETQLTPDVIQEDFRKQWIEFYNRRTAAMAAKIRHIVHEASPGSVFSVYSGYQSDQTKESYGVDWQMLADNIDLAMCGYGRHEETLNTTLKALGDTPLVLGHIVYPYDIGSRQYPAFMSKATLLRRLVDGTRGVLVYTFDELDGRTFHALSEISPLVADYEDLFLAHKTDNSLVSVTGISPYDVTVFTGNGKRLIMVINETQEKKRVKLTNRQFGPKMRVFDYFAKKDLGNQEEIAAEVLPEDVSAFVVSE